MSKRPTKVLIAWEMGAGLGHLVPLARIAGALVQRGMVMASAYLCSTENAAVLAPLMSGPIRTAPSFPLVARVAPDQSHRQTASFGEFLGDVGYAHPEFLAQQIGLWRRIFEEDRPDLVLADMSPTALLAARSLGIGTVATGTPYCLPPADMDIFPVLAHGEVPRLYRESDLLAKLNQVLHGFGAEPQTAFPQVFEADLTAVASFRVLDYYDGQRAVPILPPLQTSVPPSDKPGNEVIAYFSTPGPVDAPEWEALARLDMPLVIIAPELDAAVRAKLNRPNITLQHGLLPPTELAARARVLVSNGNHGTLCLAVRAALPQVCLPLHGDHAANCANLGTRGLATIVPLRNRTAADISSAIQESYESQLRLSRARALAAEVAPVLAVDAATAIADQIEAVVDMRAEYFSPPQYKSKPVRQPLPQLAAGATTALRCYRIHANAPEFRPARSERQWMNDTSDRYAYRCVPLAIANSSGWEMLLPTGFVATWDGGSSIGSIQLKALDGGPVDSHLVSSHFGHGVLTMHTGYLLRTDPGWGIWVRGAPNEAKDGIAALDGLVETDWLPFPFTMNWRFTRPCTVRFEQGEVFCFVTPVAHMALEQIEPELLYLDEDAGLKAEYEAWSTSRAQFLTRLMANDAETVKEAWQKFYLRGATATGQQAPDSHRAKRRLSPGRAQTDAVPGAKPNEP